MASSLVHSAGTPQRPRRLVSIDATRTAHQRSRDRPSRKLRIARRTYWRAASIVDAALWRCLALRSLAGRARHPRPLPCAPNARLLPARFLCQGQRCVVACRARAGGSRIAHGARARGPRASRCRSCFLRDGYRHRDAHHRRRVVESTWDAPRFETHADFRPRMWRGSGRARADCGLRARIFARHRDAGIGRAVLAHIAARRSLGR